MNVTLKLLVSAVPVGLILLGLLLFKLYPIDEEKRRENKKALQDLRWVWARAESRVPGLWGRVGPGPVRRLWDASGRRWAAAVLPIPAAREAA